MKFCGNIAIFIYLILSKAIWAATAELSSCYINCLWIPYLFTLVLKTLPITVMQL